MQNEPDGEFKYIGHMVDHFTRFNVIFAMKTKSAKETANLCIERFFSVFGLPLIFQSDNGSEFVNNVISAVTVLWPGKTSLVRGSVGHSQSQGMVEQGNNTIRKMIFVRQMEENNNNWSQWLPEFQCILFCLMIHVHFHFT